MKKKKRIIKWIALGVVLTGIVALAVVAGMYSYHHAQTEDIISNFKHTVEQLQEEDNGEQDDRSNDNQTGQETEKQDDIVSNDSDFRHNGWSDGDSSVGLNYQIDKEALRNDSLRYNESLKQNQNLLLTGKNYIYAALDLTKYGIYDNIYGYVSAPSIGLELPIYLGANDTTMSLGAGHLCHTSLPTGGEDTNVVLAGHTGYIGRWLFDSVVNLREGDSVEVTTYFGSLKYKVTKVMDKSPKDGDIMFIEKGKDKLTLVTCIQGGAARRVVVCER